MAKSPPANKTSARPSTGLFAIPLLLISVFSLYKMRISVAANGVPLDFDHHVNIAKLEDGTPLKTTYTGIAGLDFFFTLLVSAFAAGPLNLDEGIRLQQIYFLCAFTAIIVVTNVEAYRKGNTARLIGFTAPWAFLYQTVGGAVICPLFFLAQVISLREDSYHNDGRAISLPYAKALLPATIVTYLLPTILMYVPFQNIETTQNIIAFWQVAPLLVSPVIVIFSFFFTASLPPQPASRAGKPAGEPEDVRHLNASYLAAFLVAASVHLYAVYAILASSSPRLGFSYVFLPNGATWDQTRSLGLHWIFQWDAIGIAAGSLVWAYAVIYDARWRLKDLSAGAVVTDLLVIGVASVVVGPFAVVAAVWWWREGRLVKTAKKEEKKRKGR
ncbi:hypothetical protein B0O99DRAFT_607532 [Bisporella sp. PMI_857]|nr:hypothetical protein B0O99DRAFT_607532 [Bisporella sp. PMI_857]